LTAKNQGPPQKKAARGSWGDESQEGALHKGDGKSARVKGGVKIYRRGNGQGDFFLKKSIEKREGEGS